MNRCLKNKMALYWKWFYVDALSAADQQSPTIYSSRIDGALTWWR